MKLAVQPIDTDTIRTDGGTQMREHLDEGWVAELMEAIGNTTSNEIDPIEVAVDPDGAVWLWDGFHRLEAYRRLGHQCVFARVRQGTRRDAILWACSANAKHGMRRSNADKRRAVETLLRDEEWSKKSDRWVAEAAGVSHPFVARVRSEPTGNGYQLGGGREGRDGKVRRRASPPPSDDAQPFDAAEYPALVAQIVAEDSGGSEDDLRLLAPPDGCCRMIEVPSDHQTELVVVSPSTSPGFHHFGYITLGKLSGGSAVTSKRPMKLAGLVRAWLAEVPQRFRDAALSGDARIVDAPDEPHQRNPFCARTTGGASA